MAGSNSGNSSSSLPSVIPHNHWTDVMKHALIVSLYMIRSLQYDYCA